MEAHELNARLEKVEAQNRSLKRWGALALALGGVMVLTSMLAVCKTVTAERFLVQDSSGRERARFTAYETGGKPVLSLLDERGQCILKIGVSDEDKAFVEVQGKSGPVRSELVATAEGRAALIPCGDALASR